MTISNNENDAIECVSIRGVIIDLRDVSPDLHRQYYMATAAIGRLNKASDDLKRIGEAILAEQLPRLAIKHAPAVRGSHAIAAKLMGLPC